MDRSFFTAPENVPGCRDIDFYYTRALSVVTGLVNDPETNENWGDCPECGKKQRLQRGEKGRLRVRSIDCSCPAEVIANALSTREARQKAKPPPVNGAGPAVNGAEAQEAPTRRKPRGYTAAHLQQMQIEPPKWAVPDYIPQGLTILAGGQKLGKSRIVYDTSVAIATGGKAFGKISVEQGEALYLALEDSDVRLQDRLLEILGDSQAPEDLHIYPEWPTIMEGGLHDLKTWLEEHTRTRLVVIDTLGAFRAGTKSTKGGNQYQEDYDLGRSLLRICRDFHLAMVVCHHINKQEEWQDPFNAVSGTIGLTGAADATLIFQRARGSNEARLRGVGRDVIDLDKAMLMDEVTGVWVLQGDYEDATRSVERQEVIALIARMGPLGPKDVADLLGKSHSSVKMLMLRMFRDGELTRSSGKYSTPPKKEGDEEEHWDR